MVLAAPPWAVAHGTSNVAKLFAATFEATSSLLLCSAPGRANVIGEHTDYNSGRCLPIALPHRTFVALAPRNDNRVRLISSQEPGLRELDLTDVGPRGSDGQVTGWPAYVVGVAWALQEAGLVAPGTTRGFDIAVDSCVPHGAGLSSSAALECAVAIGLDDLWDLGLASSREGRSTLVDVCVRAENEVAGAPTGGMDQSAALLAHSDHALLLDFGEGSCTSLPFDLAAAGLELLIIDTRAPHQLVDGQYAARRQTCEAAARRLGLSSLREVTDLDAALAGLSDAEEQARLRHVVTEDARTVRFGDLLRSGGLQGEGPEQLGALLDESHTSLALDYEVSSPELDVATEAARRAGAYGARLTGGGFGGSVIALAPANSLERVNDAVIEAFGHSGFGHPIVFPVVASGPAALHT